MLKRCFIDSWYGTGGCSGDGWPGGLWVVLNRCVCYNMKIKTTKRNSREDREDRTHVKTAGIASGNGFGLRYISGFGSDKNILGPATGAWLLYTGLLLKGTSGMGGCCARTCCARPKIAHHAHTTRTSTVNLDLVPSFILCFFLVQLATILNWAWAFISFGTFLYFSLVVYAAGKIRFRPSLGSPVLNQLRR